MDAEWAALNAAQQAALVIWTPLSLILGWKIATYAMDRRWPGILFVLLIIVASAGGAAVLILMLGGVPR